ncbi:cytochrome P450 [Dichotomocladium elegans]|nr:cytochrome P450 [Dichotomocladium elegans]
MLGDYFTLYPETLSRPNYKDIPIAPGAAPHFGHLFALAKAVPFEKLSHWQRDLGPVIQINMGVKRWIVLGDPRIAHDMLSVQGLYTSTRPFHTYTHVYQSRGRGIVFSDPSPRWKKLRAAVFHFLSPKNAMTFRPIIHNESNILIDHLTASSIKNQGVDFFKSIQLMSLNVMLLTLFGVRATSTDDPLFKKVIRLVNNGIKLASATEDIKTFFPMMSLLDILLRKEKKMANYVFTERDPVFSMLVADTIKGEQNTFIKHLHELQDERIDEETLMIVSSDMITAGTDTIAVSLSWTINILCNYPSVQRRLQREVDAFIKEKGRLPNYDDRASLPLVVSVQKECLRLRPTVPLGLPHCAIEDCNTYSPTAPALPTTCLGSPFLLFFFTYYILSTPHAWVDPVECAGYFVPKGTTIVSNIYAMHHNPDYFEDPERFVPDRFIRLGKLGPMASLANSKIDHRDHYSFGWGRYGIIIRRGSQYHACHKGWSTRLPHSLYLPTP